MNSIGFTKPSTGTIILLLLPFMLLALIFVVIYPNEFQLQSLTGIAPAIITHASNSTSFFSPEKPAFRLLMGILTLPDHYERRHLLRLVYSLEPRLNAVIDVKFVFCNLTKDDQRVLVALEIIRFDDIIILDCPENMNDGKTYTYFSSLPMLFNGSNGDDKPYDYVMKADDDTYFRLPRLVESLKKMPREDMYYGFVVPYHDYMSGMGYILSWDLVQWISSSNIPRNNSVGHEDMMTGKWMNLGQKAKKRFNTKPAMYDFPIPVPIDTCSHKFVPDTIAVHRLKDNPKWARTLKCFNVTDALKPSKLYHIP
ncbi:Glycosyl transferase family 31 protein [Dioscorea alata]|uniref:Glycosyl transferase family 31 protein n=1 Tax=Dioscorea alata TaxID=55571 RepID=A0ACB7WJ38_DIOAL|nr:Glycosyl transferase family 31 protein [Dioscorea alata]